ncbi:MAG: DUF6056 family protein [Bacteroidia bacterium]|nr:DUF6056 family protein [Bacteroidia bacterium]
MKQIYSGWSRWFVVVLSVVVLFFFTYESTSYRFSEDDAFFTQQVSEKGIAGAVSFFYQEQNGRLGAHIICCTVYQTGNFIGKPFFIFWQFLLLIAFIFSLDKLLRAILFNYNERLVISRNTLLCASLSALFFYMDRGKISSEAWHWIAASAVHTVSFILTIASAAFLIRYYYTNKTTQIISFFFLALFAGSFSESNLITTLSLLSVLLIYKVASSRKVSAMLVSGILGLLIALFINLLSPGIDIRLNQLPDFNFTQALKNTLHSCWILLKNAGWATLLFLTLLTSPAFKAEIGETLHNRLNNILVIAGLIGALLLNIFVTCYLLSDVAPGRSLLFPQFCLVSAIIIFYFSPRSKRMSGDPAISNDSSTYNG